MRRNSFVTYSVALAAVAVAIGIRLLLDPLVGQHIPFLTLFAAILFVAWYGGRGPALVTLIVGGVAAAFFLFEPRHSFAINALEYQAHLILYGIVGYAIIALFESLQRARQRAEDKQHQLEREIEARRVAEQVLANREELLRITFTSIGDGIITTDALGNVTFLNTVAQELTGWTQKEAHDKPLNQVFNIINQTSRQPAESPVEKVLRENRVVGLANHTVLISKDGKEWIIDDSAAPIRNKKGEVIGCVLVFRDVSKRRAVEVMNEQVVATLQHLTDGFWQLDQNWQFKYANAKTCRMVNQTSAQLIGKNLWEVLPALIGTEVEAEFRRVVAEHIAVELEHFYAPLGCWFALKASPTPDGGLVVLTRDITEQKQVEDALRRSERELADFFNNATMGLHWVGPDGAVLRANQAELELLGYSQEEYVGHHIAEFHADREVIDDILRRLKAGERLRNYEARMRCKDGSVKHVLIDSNVLWENGEFIHTRCFTRDITEQKRAEELHLRLAAIVESSNDAIISEDLDGTIMSWNRGAQQLYGYRADEIIGKPISVLMPPEQKNDFPTMMDRLSRGERIEHHETVRVAKDGRRLDVSLTISPVRNAQGKIIGVSKIARDITERKQVEQALKESDRRKDEFLAMLSHELRNPLAPLKNSLELMKRASGNSSLMEQTRSTMERQINHMVRLVDDLLDVSRITRNKLELKLEFLELASVLHYAAETCRSLWGHAGHKLSVTLPPDPIYLHADPVRLTQVFSNLITNSCKFTPPGGHIWVSAERQADQVIITVKDTGAGISSDMLPKVFDLFTQGNRSLEKSESGLGIGLSLVKRLVEMHGGTVTAHSEGQGQGSEFVVRIPILTEKPWTPPLIKQASPPTLTNLPLRVLVVDDNKDSAQSLVMLLRLTGNETLMAHDGIEAINKAAAFQPEVILLDIGLPKMNGYEVCRHIRKQPWARGTLIVALTGWGQDEDRRKSKEAGFDEHLVKPIDHAILMKLLTTSHSRARNQADRTLN